MQLLPNARSQSGQQHRDESFETAYQPARQPAQRPAAPRPQTQSESVTPDTLNEDDIPF